MSYEFFKFWAFIMMISAKIVAIIGCCFAFAVLVEFDPKVLQRCVLCSVNYREEPI